MSGNVTSTADFYAENAEAYASRGRTAHMERIQPFCARLALGSRILELGCGGGEDSEAMLALGFDVVPTDGSEALALLASKRLGRPVQVLLFDELDDVAAYDGIWANACLLHAPREDLPGILHRIRRALRPAGLFYASYKIGGPEGLDRFGRYFNRPEPAWLERVYRDAGWSEIASEMAAGDGYAGEQTEWLHVTAGA